MDKEKNESRRSDPKNLYQLSAELFGKQARFGAAGDSALRRTGRAKYRTAVGKHQIAKEGWSIVATDDLTVQPVPGIEEGKPVIYSEAEQALQQTETAGSGQSRRPEDPETRRRCREIEVPCSGLLRHSDMAVPTSANYVFLPWVRQGAASGIQTPDSLGANQAGVVSVPVKLRVNNTDDIDRQVRLYGPGDVTGIDPQQVVRTEPRHLATDFEPNYFPAIEFDRPDFPWLFTPAKANCRRQVASVALPGGRAQTGRRHAAHRPQSAAAGARNQRACSPEHELPDLSESWAWAHAQVTGSPAGCRFAETIVGGRPSADRIAVVVSAPARSADGLSGLCGACVRAGTQSRPGFTDSTRGRKRTEAGLDVGAQSPSQVTLPVYFHWEFRTGTGGDFEALVELLEARDSRDLPAEVGKRPMDISQPGFRVTPPLPPGTVLELEGALRRLDATTAEWPDSDSNAVPGASSKRFSMRRGRPCPRRAQTRCSRRRFTAAGRQPAHGGHDSRAAGIGDLAA